MESNIFSSVVAEPAADSENNIICPPLMAVPVFPIADSDDVKGCGLNQ